MSEKSTRRVTLAGDHAGDYVIEEERPDGTLVLAPETPHQAGLRRQGLRQMTTEEFDDFVREHGPHMQPPDDEG